MSEMVERVACAVMACRVGQQVSPSLTDLAIARAAIAAMRQPTEVMWAGQYDETTVNGVMPSGEERCGIWRAP